MSDAFDALRTRHYRLGENRDFCPGTLCADRTKKHEKTLAVHADNEVLKYHCWHCGEKGVVPLSGSVAQRFQPRSEPVKPMKPVEFRPLLAEDADYLRGRGISSIVAQWCNCVSGEIRGESAVGYSYFVEGQRSGIKFRANDKDTHGRRATRISGTLQTLFLQDRINQYHELDLLRVAPNVPSASSSNVVPLRVGAGEGVVDELFELDNEVISLPPWVEVGISRLPSEHTHVVHELITHEVTKEAGAHTPAHTHARIRTREPGEIIIVEGEADALSCVEAGLANVTSVPHGAVNENTQGRADDAKLAWITGQPDFWKPFRRIILACDADGSGRVTAQEIARRLGRWRTFIVEYPAGYKDANEVLIGDPDKGLPALGPDALAEMIEQAKPMAVEGLFRASTFKADVKALYRGEKGKGLDIGIASVKPLFRPAPGNLICVTGMPKSGKSEFVDQVGMNLAEACGWKTAVWSPENGIPPHVAKLIEKRARGHFYQGQANRITEEALERAESFVDEHFLFLGSGDGGNTIKSILERARAASVQFNCKSLVIDPYNYVSKSGEREDQAISEMLTECRQFAQDHEAIVWFIAHPRTVDTKGRPVNGNHIAGGITWYAKCDFGITIHRMERKSQLYVWACRWAHLGQEGVTDLKYLTDEARFVDGDDFFGNLRRRRDVDELEEDEEFC